MERPESALILSAESLPPDHYRVFMPYTDFPHLADLRKEFDLIDDFVFDGRPWELHPSCVGLSRTPGDRIFFLHNPGESWDPEEQIVWGLAHRTAVAQNGYRPVTHDEEYEFQKAHPELLCYVALGSFVKYSRRMLPIVAIVDQRIQRRFGGCFALGPLSGPSGPLSGPSVLYIAR